MCILNCLITVLLLFVVSEQNVFQSAHVPAIKFLNLLHAWFIWGRTELTKHTQVHSLAKKHTKPPEWQTLQEIIRVYQPLYKAPVGWLIFLVSGLYFNIRFSQTTYYDPSCWVLNDPYNVSGEKAKSSLRIHLQQWRKGLTARWRHGTWYFQTADTAGLLCDILIKVLQLIKKKKFDSSQYIFMVL